MFLLYLRNEFKAVVAEFIVTAAEERASDSAEGRVFFDLRLVANNN